MVTVPIHGINEKLDGSIASDQKRSYVRTSEDITSLADHVAAALTHTFSGLVFTSFVGPIAPYLSAVPGEIDQNPHIYLSSPEGYKISFYARGPDSLRGRGELSAKDCYVGIITVHPGEPPFVALRDEPFSRVEQEAIERYRS